SSSVVSVLAQEAYKALIDRRRGNDLRPGELSDPVDQPSSMSAATLDDLRDSRPPQCPDSRVRDKSPAASRPFGVPILLISKVVAWNGITGILGKGGAMRGRVRYKYLTRIERQIQPFVSVRRP